MVEHNTKVQDHKVAALEAMKSRLGTAKDYIFTDYRGLTVDQITELRRELQKKSADYRVIKNRYAKLAFADLEQPDVSSLLVGPTALALSQEDASGAARVIFDRGKEWPVSIKGALIDGKVYDAAQTEAISKLPGREALLSSLAGTMMAPVQNLAFALNGVTQKLVRVLQAIADQKESA